MEGIETSGRWSVFGATTTWPWDSDCWQTRSATMARGLKAEGGAVLSPPRHRHPTPAPVPTAWCDGTDAPQW